MIRIFQDNHLPPKGKENEAKHDECDPPKFYDTLADELKTLMEKSSISIRGTMCDLLKRFKNSKIPIPTKKMF